MAESKEGEKSVKGWVGS